MWKVERRCTCSAESTLVAAAPGRDLLRRVVRRAAGEDALPRKRVMNLAVPQHARTTELGGRVSLIDWFRHDVESPGRESVGRAGGATPLSRTPQTTAQWCVSPLCALPPHTKPQRKARTHTQHTLADSPPPPFAALSCCCVFLPYLCVSVRLMRVYSVCMCMCLLALCAVCCQCLTISLDRNTAHGTTAVNRRTAFSRGTV